MPLPDSLLASACALYQTDPSELTPLSGGHYNAVFEFLAGDQPAILRLGVADCPARQTLAMMEWVRFLSAAGAPVTAPLVSVNRHLVETLLLYGTPYTLTAFMKAEGTLAEDIPPSDWTDGLFQSIGKATGVLHHLSSTYRPARPGLTRPLWHESAELEQATRALACAPGPAAEQLTALLAGLRQLPTGPADFGLIHADLHCANFLVGPGGRVTIIDFDDCAYGWFAMDVAMALLDVLVLYDPADETAAQAFARRFLANYLSGYRQEFELSPFSQAHIPHFLKLKELCLYATLQGHADVDQPGTWVGRFMRGREQRIAHDLPYIDIDFCSLDILPEAGLSAPGSQAHEGCAE